MKPTKSAIKMMTQAKMELPYANAPKMILVDNIENKISLKELFETMVDVLPERVPNKKKKKNINLYLRAS